MHALPPALATLAFALHAGLAQAQVYKCLDAAGNVTYQEAPCSAGQRGGTVELKDPVTVRPGVNESAWSIPAREGRVIVGMPKPFVTEALGKPGEIRAPRTGEAGSEVWVYQKAGQVTRVGFQNNAVAWVRSEATTPEPKAAPAATDRSARVRDALQVGKPCASVLQEAGPADREEPLLAGNTSGARYVYALDASNANAYAAFVCLGGRVTSVERYTPEKAR